MGPGIWQLLIILAIVLLLFGAKRLRNIGGDLGASIKSFRSAMKEGEEEKPAPKSLDEKPDEKIIEGEVTSRKKDKAS